MKRRIEIVTNDGGGKSSQNLALKRSKDPDKLSEQTSSATEGIFKGVTAFVLPAAMGKARLQVFKNIILNNGGKLLNSCSSGVVTHMIADDGVTVACLQAEIEKDSNFSDGAHPVCVKTKWLSDCVKAKQKLDVTDYVFLVNSRDKDLKANVQKKVFNTTSSGVEAEKRERGIVSPSVGIDSQNSEGVTELKVSDSRDTISKINKSKFACSVSSGNQEVNHNKHITDKLEVLATTFKSLKDQWRSVSYERAISVLKSHPKEITTWEEARSLRGVGERLADKIWEIVQSGGLRKMDEVCSGEKMKALNLFMDIWGVGPSTAQQLVQQGFRTLNDLRNSDGVLNRQQNIGLKYYDEFLERIPREEAAEIESTVRKAAVSLQRDMIAVACGSYRRGKATCGDVDVLVTHEDGKSHKDFLRLLVANLHQSGFLTDDLVSQETSGEQHKYMGVCHLPGPHSKHRRLDIIVVPYNEYACAMLYFTGSAHFNRSMRLLANKMNMSLSEHSLNAGVVRSKGHEKVCGGYPLPTPTEESVFEHIGIPYRPPEERDH